jgi:hypothetical protein
MRINTPEKGLILTISMVGAALASIVLGRALGHLVGICF